MPASPLTVLCVLRTGGDFAVPHVWALRRQLNRHLPLPYRSPLSSPEAGTWTFRCLTDAQGLGHFGVPLEHGWPGWWSKLEICRPSISGPVLFLDLDTVLVGDLGPLVEDLTRSIVLRDLYRGRSRPNAVQSSMMLLTEADRALVWEHFQATGGGERWVGRSGGDQVVFEEVLGSRSKWQDTHPGMVVGYKSNIRRPGLTSPPEDARVVIFHGEPRPWESGHDWATPDIVRETPACV